MTTSTVTMVVGALVAGALGCSKSEPKGAAPEGKAPEPVPAADAGATASGVDAGTAAGSAAAKPEATPPAAQPGITVTLDGKPVPIQGALAFDERQGTAVVYLTNYPQTCKDRVSLARSSQETDVEIKLRVGAYVAKDGTKGWALRGTYYGGTSSEKESGGTPLPDAKVDPAAGATFALPLAYDHDKLAMKGSVQVTGCGEDPRFKLDPDPTPVGDGTIELAGHTLPIGGAGLIVDRDGYRKLELSTHPVKCVEGSDYTSSRGDVELELVWDKAGTLIRVERDGRWVDWGVTQTGTIGLTASPNRPAGKTMTIKLGGSAEVGDYPVKLAGKVTAITCPTPK